LKPRATKGIPHNQRTFMVHVVMAIPDAITIKVNISAVSCRPSMIEADQASAPASSTSVVITMAKATIQTVVRGLCCVFFSDVFTLVYLVPEIVTSYKTRRHAKIEVKGL
jgi:hypothetical protein